VCISENGTCARQRRSATIENVCVIFLKRCSSICSSLRPSLRAKVRGPTLRKRFYGRAQAREASANGGFPLLFDGKQVRMPARRLLAAPACALAERIAEEWNAQEDVIDPARMPLSPSTTSIMWPE
jgi:chaperone required for assembly of F1-ATPase